MAIFQTGQLGVEPESEFRAVDLFHTLLRRKWSGVGVAFVGVCVTVAAALLWPPTYRSTVDGGEADPSDPLAVIASRPSGLC